jgi:predicted nucleic acid-binding protein
MLMALDPGERSAITLGLSLKADLILIDDRKGASIALNKGFEITGTLGVLDLVARRHLINLRDALDRLKRTNFRYRQTKVPTSGTTNAGTHAPWTAPAFRTLIRHDQM